MTVPASAGAATVALTPIAASNSQPIVIKDDDDSNGPVDVATEVGAAGTALAAFAAIVALLREGRRRKKDEWRTWLFETVTTLADVEHYKRWEVSPNHPWDLRARALELTGIASRLDRARFGMPLLPGIGETGPETVELLRQTNAKATELSSVLGHAANLSDYLRLGTGQSSDALSAATRENFEQALLTASNIRDELVLNATAAFASVQKYARHVERESRSALFRDDDPG